MTITSTIKIRYLWDVGLHIKMAKNNFIKLLKENWIGGILAIIFLTTIEEKMAGGIIALFTILISYELIIKILIVYIVGAFIQSKIKS